MKKIHVLILISLLASCDGGIPDLISEYPHNTTFQRLDSGVVSRTASITLENLDPYFANPDNQDYVLSPASYLLATSGLIAVSDGFDHASFGLVEDVAEDVKDMLNAWNFEYEFDSSTYPDYCYFRSAVLHQQVGPTYEFDLGKRQEVADDYIATMVSSLSDYHERATAYFHEEIGLNIAIPDPNLTSDGVITYGGLKMKDYIARGLGEVQNDFFLGESPVSVKTYSFGSVYYPKYIAYYDGEGYQAFKLNVNMTDLLVILPDEGTAIDSLSVSEAYSSFMTEKTTVEAMGYVPYFHLTTENADLTDALLTKLTDQEAFFSKLLTENVVNDLFLSSVLQASDFEFNQYGVSGESITVETLYGTSEPIEHDPIELKVNRPFYAISLKDDFPIFVNKVNDPTN